MDCLDRIEQLQKKIRAEIEVTKIRMLFLLGLFEVSPELKREILELLKETKSEDSCVGNSTHSEREEQG